MKSTTPAPGHLEALMIEMRAARVPFALATVVRTFDATGAKAGAKALVSAEGEIVDGWIGGGCVRAAIGRAARAAIARGEPKLVALRPEDRLSDEGLAACEVRDGITYERNGCASKGSMDIFVEPHVPAPDLVILGDGPVARALGTLARPLDLRVLTELPDDAPGAAAFVVVATQGKGDAATLGRALAARPAYLAFVGARRKFESLRDRLAAGGAEGRALDAVVAPAGLPIGAKTPEEIALAILAQIVETRRRAGP